MTGSTSELSSSEGDELGSADGNSDPTAVDSERAELGLVDDDANPTAVNLEGD